MQLSIFSYVQEFSNISTEKVACRISEPKVSLNPIQMSPSSHNNLSVMGFTWA